MTYLLDVNVLIALFDAAHAHYEPAHRWFAATAKGSWATCPLTENGFVRIVSNPRYSPLSVSPQEAASRLRTFCSVPEHVFWSDVVSIIDPALFDLSKLQGPRQVGDMYLAGLAHHYGGKLATFDANIPVVAVVGAPANVVELIPTR